MSDSAIHSRIPIRHPQRSIPSYPKDRVMALTDKTDIALTVAINSLIRDIFSKEEPSLQKSLSDVHTGLYRGIQQLWEQQGSGKTQRRQIVCLLLNKLSEKDKLTEFATQPLIFRGRPDPRSAIMERYRQFKETTSSGVRDSQTEALTHALQVEQKRRQETESVALQVAELAKRRYLQLAEKKAELANQRQETSDKDSATQLLTRAIQHAPKRPESQ